MSKSRSYSRKWRTTEMNWSLLRSLRIRGFILKYKRIAQQGSYLLGKFVKIKTKTMLNFQTQTYCTWFFFSSLNCVLILVGEN